MFEFGPENKEEIAKKIVNLLAVEGVKVGDVWHILTAVKNITDANIEKFYEIEKEKSVEPIK